MSKADSSVPSSPTIRDIAARAGVSTGTVSRALKGQAGLTRETREHVLAVAAALGYNHTKLRPVKARRLGFLLHESHSNLASNPFYFPVLHGVEVACRNSGIAFTYSSVGSPQEVKELIALLEVDGLVCAGYWEHATLAEIVRAGKPVVLVDHDAAGLPSVNIDNVSGAYQATQHLIAMGRQRIAMITGPDEHYSIRQRVEGYHHALLDAGRTPEPRLLVRRTVDTDEGNQAAVAQVLDLSPQPDAIFAYNDRTALAALQECARQGLRVPEDLAVVGFDDITAARYSQPDLTTIAVDKEGLGREAVRLLLHPRPLERAHVTVPVRLVIRGSSRARRA
ncbi:DNA-binding LacI/PurR family transcriptional regulator [Deinococcus metalli]|uniref:DNA-binding LacI/PurR family transcriptional regulator n=1 Tax=Deinococcus metalli TaxID=1141878 RepID=A0A7W8NS11_9DEIO|nr:LacI family DNA-binding transcriptional regulator [Deinococcus metalli]MBB5376672.1 DNA-binding LacI/PurR family transcriptional regulator [Deinococcus metalli]GHF42341.1 LacI family transcriptional regulator [Deinococcus metalli]